MQIPIRGITIFILSNAVCVIICPHVSNRCQNPDHPVPIDTKAPPECSGHCSNPSDGNQCPFRSDPGTVRKACPDLPTEPGRHASRRFRTAGYPSGWNARRTQILVSFPHSSSAGRRWMPRRHSSADVPSSKDFQKAPDGSSQAP